MLTLGQCWLILGGCIASEVMGSACLKLSNNYRNLLPSILMFVCYAISIAGFPFSLTRIDLGTAYAVWSGVGTVATAVIGIVAFSEKATWTKLIGVVVVIAGVIILNISEAEEEKGSPNADVIEMTTLVSDDV